MCLNDTELILHRGSIWIEPKKNPKQNKIRRWMKEWYIQIAQNGHEKLLNSLRVTGPDDYRNFLR